LTNPVTLLPFFGLLEKEFDQSLLFREKAAFNSAASDSTGTNFLSIATIFSENKAVIVPARKAKSREFKSPLQAKKS
jgi:hypothetical protein